MATVFCYSTGGVEGSVEGSVPIFKQRGMRGGDKKPGGFSREGVALLCNFKISVRRIGDDDAVAHFPVKGLPTRGWLRKRASNVPPLRLQGQP